MSLGFIGAGTMAEALIRGLLHKGVLSPEDIAIYDVRLTRMEELERKYSILAVKDKKALEGKDTVVLAVKPPDWREALEGFHLKEKGLLISLVAGLPLKRLSGQLGEKAIIRAMPNTPVLVGEGMTVLSPNPWVTEEQLQRALQLFQSVGRALVLPENVMNGVTALSGSGPAYIYLVIEALADGGVRQGLPREAALELAVQTVLGAARMVRDTGEHPAVLKDRVASPGGTTIEALALLEEKGVRGAFIRAVEAAAHRAEKLGEE
ncbi:MAG TPA: pyrroline-5-carboxylate reductase [Moorella mulderi]|nr:pyrroline-5-carboxylate reductase [Moorella mulderi]